jgi:hypothetical protein
MIQTLGEDLNVSPFAPRTPSQDRPAGRGLDDAEPIDA